MSELFRTTILGAPIGQGRPRAVRMGPFVRVHSAKKSSEWEAIAAQHLRAVWLGEMETRAAHDRPVRLHVAAYRPRPKSVRKCDGMGVLWSTSKPDLDNIVKSVCDALVKAGVIRDDVLVASLRADSYVTEHDQPARVVELVETVEPLPVVPWPAKQRATKT